MLDANRFPLTQTLRKLYRRLSRLSDTPELDAQVLVAHIVGKPRAWVLAHPEVELTGRQRQSIEEAMSRLESGEPLPYVLGHWEFFGLDFIVTPDVLIPRPETELLVEQALAWLAYHADRRQAADIGTGSGCIAVSIAVHAPDIQILATDRSEAALSVARKNAQLHKVCERITFSHQDLLSQASTPIDMICANLPYIPTQTLHQLEVYGREPEMALDGGSLGLEHISRLIAQSTRLLAPGGLLLLEIEASQGESASELARQSFPGAAVRLLPDLAGKDRLISIQLTSSGGNRHDQPPSE